MDNKTLDGILIALRDKYNGATDRYQLMKENRSMTTNFDSSITLLIQRKYIIKDSDGQKFLLRITAEGERFLQEGGFTSDAQYKEQTLKVAEESKKYAKWAFWLSAIGIFLTILIYFLDHAVGNIFKK